MSLTILLVEDEPLVRELARDVLISHGYSVVTAPSAADALRVLVKGTSVDLLVTDIMMEGVNGIELVEQAKRLRPELRVLYISGYAPPRMHVAPKHGPLLQKPFRMAELLGAVAAVLGEPKASA